MDLQFDTEGPTIDRVGSGYNKRPAMNTESVNLLVIQCTLKYKKNIHKLPFTLIRVPAESNFSFSGQQGPIGKSKKRRNLSCEMKSKIDKINREHDRLKIQSNLMALAKDQFKS